MVVSIKINNELVDDYVIDASPIPLFKRNKFYEPTLFGFDLTLSDSYTPIKNYDVDVYIDGVHRFSGYIDKTKYYYDQRVYKVEVLESLIKLEDYLVEYDTLHSDLLTSAGYYNSDSQGYPHVRLDSLLKVMFAKVGLELDTSDLSNDASFYYYSGIHWGWTDFVLDENMLYCINQNYTMNHRLIDASDEPEVGQLGKSKITFLEFVQRVCIGFELILKENEGKNKYKVYKRDSTSASIFSQYSVPDDYKYNYELDTDNLSADNGIYMESKAHSNGGFRDVYSGIVFTADSTTDTIISSDHGLSGGEMVQFSGEVLPSGISEGVTYKVKTYSDDSDNRFRLEKNDLIINFTDNGSGTMYYYPQLTPKTEHLGNGSYNIPIWSHFRIFLTSGNGVIYGSYPQTTVLMYGGYENYKGLPEVETIVTDDNVIDFSKVDILELNLDIKNRLYELVQEIK